MPRKSENRLPLWPVRLGLFCGLASVVLALYLILAEDPRQKAQWLAHAAALNLAQGGAKEKSRAALLEALAFDSFNPRLWEMLAGADGDESPKAAAIAQRLKGEAHAE